MADNDNDVEMPDSQQQDDEEEVDYEYEDDEDMEFEDDEEFEEEPEEEEENIAIDDNDMDAADFADQDDADFNDGADEWGDDNDGDGGWDEDDAVDDINNDDNIMCGAKQNQFEATIPEMTSKGINSNCDEINMIPLFAAAPDLKSRSRIGAMIAIRVANLTNVTTDQLEVWGLTPEYPFIALKFEFGPFYLNEAKLPKVEVGMCKTLSADEKLHAFRLSWTIEERVSNAMLTNKEWPPRDIDMKDIPLASQINDLMESSAKEYALCLEALNKYKGDDQQALSLLLDENQSAKLAKNLPSIAKCTSKFTDIMSKISTSKQEEKSQWNFTKSSKSLKDEYEDASDQKKIQQLAEMYNVPLQAAAIAYDTLGYDQAVGALSDPDQRLNYVEMAGSNDTSNNNNNNTNNKKSNGFLSSIFGSKSKDKPKTDDDIKLDPLPDFKSMVRTHSGGGRLQLVQPEHFFRSIVVMEKHNFLLRCVCFALKVLLNGNKYCMICDKELAFAGLKPTICSDRFCQWRHDQIGLGFSLSQEVINRPDICDLLISMTYSASNAGRIQFFFPTGVRGLDPDTQNESFLLSSSGNGEPTDDDMKNFDPQKFANGEAKQPKPNIAKLKEVIDLCPSIEEMQPWAKDGDITLKKELTKIHPLLYPLLVWIITSNRCHLRRLPESDRIKAIETEYQFALCAATPDREKQFQDLRQSNGSFLAWHGSPMGNWHSILRMGLRNYSKTKHQSNGAAYGSGIYFGRNFSLSWGYCRPGSNPGWKKSKFGTAMSCMALCEICYHRDDAKHHRGKGSVYAKDYDPNLSTKNAKMVTSSDWTRTTNKTNRWVKTSGIYVVDQEECVMTRFFLIFPKTSGYKQLEANSLMGSLPNVVRAFK